MRKAISIIILDLITLGQGGCASLAGVGSDLFGGIADLLSLEATALTPLEPQTLTEIFAKATTITWTNDAADLTDAFQPDIANFYNDLLGNGVLPAYYLNERFYALGELTVGDVLTLEFPDSLVDCVLIYDAEFSLLAYWSPADSSGNLRPLELHILRPGQAHYLRVSMIRLSETGKTIIRVTRNTGQELPAPRPQTVVLNFAGVTNLTYRNGSLLPTTVAPITNTTVRDAATQTFREIFAQYNLTVLTDQDLTPNPPFSTIHIGPATPGLDYLGLAESVDGMNDYQDDEAIVDTNDTMLNLTGVYGAETHGRAVGRVAAHEMGHLLGLLHTLDPDDLMTGSGAQGTGLDLQRYLNKTLKKAPILDFNTEGNQWMTTGCQDTPRYLTDLLGVKE